MEDSKENLENIKGIDEPLSLYDLTDLFYSYYSYHENTSSSYYVNIDRISGQAVSESQIPLSRFKVLRRIEASKLGSRPFLSNEGISPSRPNVSLGYMRMLLDYISLPYKSIFRDSDLVKVQIDRPLYEEDNLSQEERDTQKITHSQAPDILDSAEISRDVTNAYIEVLRTAKETKKCFNELSIRVVQDGAVGVIHPDIGWRPEPVCMLDLVFEPFSGVDTSEWSTFFVIRKMSAEEAKEKIRTNEEFWDEQALRWALESAHNNKGLLSFNSHSAGGLNPSTDEANVTGENFTIRSWYSEKSSRISDIGGYWGYMTVIEAYYRNLEGKINKVIFYPSLDAVGLDKKLKNSGFNKINRSNINEVLSESALEELGLKGAGVLFHRKDVAECMSDVLTIIPFDRSEPSLERQRAYGHELFTPIEVLMRIDSAMLFIILLMSTIYKRDEAQADSAEKVQDLVLKLGDIVDMGQRKWVENPFAADLNAIIAARQILIQHINAKAYIGGLDGAEKQGKDREFELSGLRLIKDGRVIKHNIEDVSEGLTEFYSKVLSSILKNDETTKKDLLVKKLFFDKLLKVLKHPEGFFELKEDDILPDTGLPYWMRVSAVRNGGTQFGPAEMIQYRNLQAVFGDVLSQKEKTAMARKGIKSMLGNQDAMDILGDPFENVIDNIDQLYWANLETTSILGSVDRTSINFIDIPVLPTKHDHLVHLTQSHNPKAQEIIQRLQEGDVDPQSVQDLTEDELDTRTNLILKLAAIANHIQPHMQELERFGNKRDDVNQLKEDTNSILQSAESLLNNLQITMRAAQEKRAEKEMKLRGEAPGSEEERAKIELELKKIQEETVRHEKDIQLALRLEQSRKAIEDNKQVSKYRDREFKKKQHEDSVALKIRDQEIQRQKEQGKRDKGSKE